MPSRKPKSLAKLLWVLFAGFIVYGTTIPFRFQLATDHLVHRAAGIHWFPLIFSPGGDYQPADWLQNLLLFIPFGFLGYVAVADKRPRWKPFAMTALGCALSLSVEFLQLFSETRHTALSDVLLNTLGTALGITAAILLRTELARLNSRPLLRRLLDAEPAFPTIVFALIAAAGAWMPFDFALSGATLRAKIHLLPDTVHALEWAAGDLLTFTRFACLTLFASRLFREAGIPGGRIFGALCAWGFGLGLEAGQFLVESQCPDFQGFVVLSLAVPAGLACTLLPSFRDRPVAWGSVITFWFAAAIAFSNLFPFRFSGFTGNINWIPFLPRNFDPSFTTLSGFMQEAAAYSSVGVIWAYLLSCSGRGRRSGLWVTLGFTLASGVCMEALRRGLPGGEANVTWLIGAMAGSLGGWIFIGRGWGAYREYVRAGTPDKKP